MFAWSVQIISGLDNQSNFRTETFALFTGRHVDLQIFLSKYFAQIYRAQYGAAMLVYLQGRSVLIIYLL